MRSAECGMRSEKTEPRPAFAKATGGQAARERTKFVIRAATVRERAGRLAASVVGRVQSPELRPPNSLADGSTACYTDRKPKFRI